MCPETWDGASRPIRIDGTMYARVIESGKIFRSRDEMSRTLFACVPEDGFAIGDVKRWMKR